jgi:sugar-phosphatase
MIEAVIFDMDGLLIDSEPFWQLEEFNAFAKKGVVLTPEMQEETYGLGTMEVIMHWYNYKPWANFDPDEIKKEVFDNMKAHILREGKPKKGVNQVLQYFIKKKLPIGLASSSPREIITAAMEVLGLKNDIKVTVSAEDTGFGKPHPSVYIEAARQLGAEPARCLAFEDSFNGLIAAKAARMKTVIIPEPPIDQPRYSIADIRLSSLEEFDNSQFEYINSMI